MVLSSILRLSSQKLAARQSYRTTSVAARRFFSAESSVKTTDAPAPIDVNFNDESEVSPNVQKALDAVVSLNMLEVAELATALQDKFGFSSEMMAGSMGGSGGAAVEEEVKEEKTIFDVKLTGFDAKSKIKVIKEVRALTGLGLKEAKALVEDVPSILKKDIKKEEAEEIMKKISEVGGTLEME